LLSDQGIFLNSLGNIVHTKEGKITIELSKKDFLMMHDDNEDDALRGDVKDITCEWKDEYKNGKTLLNLN